MNKWQQLSEGDEIIEGASVPSPPSSSSVLSPPSKMKYNRNKHNNDINDQDFGELITINFSDDIPDTDNHNSDSKNNSSVCGATMNFINSIVGAGIIGIPYAIGQCGFFMGVIMLILIAYLINRSVIMLIECGLEKGKLDLEELCEHLLGIKGYYLSLTSMMMFAIGGMIAYLVIYGDTMPYVLNAILASYDVTVSRELVMCISATFIILPLCLMKNLESLEWTSSFSVISDIALALIVAIGAPAAAAQQGIKMESSQLAFARSTIFAGMGTISFAFVCQHNSFLVFRSLKEPTQKTWTKVAHGSLMVSFSICCTFGLAGYLNFLDQTRGNVLDNFSDSDRTISVARFFLAICMILTFPMECFVARHCLLSIMNKYYTSISTTTTTTNNNYSSEGSILKRVVDIFSSSSKSSSYTSKKLASEDTNDDNSRSIVMNTLHSKNDNIQTTEEKDENGMDNNENTFNILDSTPARIAVTVFLWASTLIVSIIANDLSIVLALTGCLAASFLGYIIPGLVYIKTYDCEFHQMINSIINNHTISFISIIKFGLPLFMIIFGLLSLVIGVTTVIFFDPNE